MARIVLISPYLKGGQNAAKLAQRTRYVATRPGVELLVDELGDGWSVVGVQRGDVFTDAQQDAKFVLKYDGVLAAGADTTAMFCTVQVPTGIDNDSAAQFRAIDVTAQAIQQDGFANWEAAFAAFDAA